MRCTASKQKSESNQTLRKHWIISSGLFRSYFVGIVWQRAITEFRWNFLHFSAQTPLLIFVELCTMCGYKILIANTKMFHTHTHARTFHLLFHSSLRLYGLLINYSIDIRNAHQSHNCRRSKHFTRVIRIIEFHSVSVCLILRVFIRM